MGTTGAGNRALFRECGSGPSVVAQHGDELNGTASIDAIELWDGLNLDAHVAFWARQSDASEAIWVATGCALHATCPMVPGGRVVFSDTFRTPVADAWVEAYRIVPPDDTLEPLPGGRVTDALGGYAMPDEFNDPQYLSDRLGIRAVVNYTDPVTGFYNYIVNYPNNDPLPPAGQITGGETIVFPLPVVLHAGWTDGTTGWRVFDEYLREDAAISPTKRQGPFQLPAFMTFLMPSRQEDGVSWGYDNSLPFSAQQHNHNIIQFDAFIHNRVHGSLQEIVPDDAQRDRLPVNLCAHSMGGIVTRGWLHNSMHTGPPVARYVSFDGVQGATTFGPPPFAVVSAGGQSVPAMGR